MALSFSDQILSLDASEGIVIGVLGPWGSGKTSFVNLARVHLESLDVPVVDFNPWMFSGAEQLVERFFVELSAQLKVRPRFSEIAKSLGEYGELLTGMGWLPVVGPWIERTQVAGKALRRLAERRSEGVGGRRARVEGALRGLSKPIVVVIDDIDRLTTSEIRDIFKLVRLTASFPNVVYVVAFDRGRVERALSEEGIAGRDYLEKILQVAIDLPSVPEAVMCSQIFQAIDSALSGLDEKALLFDKARWADVFAEVVRPLVRNMRDVRRYAAAVRGTVSDLRGQIALVDLLGLEAVRVFLPDVLGAMHRAVEGLTTVSGGGGGHDYESPRLKKQIDDIIGLAGDRKEVALALVARMFPAALRHIGGSHYGSDWEGEWLRERRVANPDVLQLYLERVAGEGLQAFADAERAWECIADATALDACLRSVEPSRLEGVIDALVAYEARFAPEQVVPATTVLLNLLRELPERERGMFDLGPEFVVRRAVYRLVRSLKKADAIEAAVRQVLPQIKSIAAKELMVTIVGYREGSGHELISREAAQDLERSWRSIVRAATPESLSLEPGLLGILLRARRSAQPDEPPLEIPNAAHLTLSILRSARNDIRSQAIDSRAIHRSPRLEWPALIEVFGDEGTLKERIGALRAENPGDQELLDLANNYAGGWRPQERGED
jgi:hypothetical protein